MTVAHAPPFRAEHVGSLLRPSELTQAFRAFNAGTISADAFRAVQDKVIGDAVTTQESLGLKLVTDGEFRRASYLGALGRRRRRTGCRTSAFRVP